MTDRTTFRLPGHELNDLAERKCLLSFLAAYSRQWNPCNLEAPWYEPWTQVFADLIAGHASLSVAPQAYLWYDLAYQGKELHTTPGSPRLLSTEDEQSNEQQDDVGNITLDSIRTISVESHRNRCHIPDIVVTRKVSFLRPQNTSQLFHLARRVTYLGIPLLAELKASGARCNNIQTSLANARIRMSFTRDQVVKQALHLFQMYPHQHSVILVAITGFWWSYMVLLRTDVDGWPVVDDVDEELPEESEELDPTLPDQNGIHADSLQVPSDSSEEYTEALQEQLYGFSLSSLQNVSTEESQFHTVLPENCMQLCEGTWSNYILYGTVPSNQVLSLILDRLHSVVHVHYDGRMG